MPGNGPHPAGMNRTSFSLGRISCQQLPIQLSHRVWRLGTYHLAVYLVRGDAESLLFEVGISSTAPLVLAQLAELGVPKEEIRYLVLTHAHSDHATGQARLMAALPRAELVMSRASLRHLSKPETALRFRDEEVFTSSVIMDPTSIKSLARDSDPEALSESMLIKEPGESVALDGIELELLGAEGHVPGGLVGWLPAEGVLLASDSAGFCSLGEPAFPLNFVSYTDYQSNLVKQKSLNPETLGLGHQDCFAGSAASAYLERAIEQQAKEHQGIMAGIKAGRGKEALAQDIYERYYHDELAIYPPDTIMNCCRLLVRRSLEHEEG